MDFVHADDAVRREELISQHSWDGNTDSCFPLLDQESRGTLRPSLTALSQSTPTPMDRRVRSAPSVSVESDIVDGRSTLRLPMCKPIFLITAPRHGSTWLLDSVENCRFRREGTKNGTFDRVNTRVELWNTFQKGIATNKPAANVIPYIVSTVSLKLFPVAWGKRRKDAYKVLVDTINAKNVAVVDAAVMSYVLAWNIRHWHRNMKGAKVRRLMRTKKGK